MVSLCLVDQRPPAIRGSATPSQARQALALEQRRPSSTAAAATAPWTTPASSLRCFSSVAVEDVGGPWKSGGRVRLARACLQSRGELRARHVLPLCVIPSLRHLEHWTVHSVHRIAILKKNQDYFFADFCDFAAVNSVIKFSRLAFLNWFWSFEKGREKLHCNPCPHPGAAYLGLCGLEAAWSLWPPKRLGLHKLE